MAESNSPKGSSNVFARKVQRQLSRGKEKVLQKLGKSVETKDDQFDQYLQCFYDQQTDGNRIHKDLRAYLNAVRDMREASRRLSQSLFDVYENDWVGEDDLGAIVEGEDLLWNDFEVKLLDQAIRTMESYVSQFPDVRERIAKRGRKLVDYDSARHHLESLQNAKKRDDVKIGKAEEEMNAAKAVYEGINNELKEELPVLHDSRIGCYVAVFLAVSNLRDTFLKEVGVLNQDLHNVISELQAQHPEKQFYINGVQRYGSLKRRTLMSPRAWKASFNEFHRNYNPKSPSRFSFKSPNKPKHGTLTRESSATTGSPPSTIIEQPSPEPADLDSTESHSEIDTSSQTQDAASSGKPSQGEESSPAEDKPEEKPEEKPEDKDEGEVPAQPETTKKEEEVDEVEKKSPPSASSSEDVDLSSDSVSLEQQLSAADPSPLHIEEDDRPTETPKTNGLEHGETEPKRVFCVDLTLTSESKNTTV